MEVMQLDDLLNIVIIMSPTVVPLLRDFNLFQTLLYNNRLLIVKITFLDCESVNNVGSFIINPSKAFSGLRSQEELSLCTLEDVNMKSNVPDDTSNILYNVNFNPSNPYFYPLYSRVSAFGKFQFLVEKDLKFYMMKLILRNVFLCTPQVVMIYQNLKYCGI